MGETIKNIDQEKVLDNKTREKPKKSLDEMNVQELLQEEKRMRNEAIKEAKKLMNSTQHLPNEIRYIAQTQIKDSVGEAFKNTEMLKNAQSDEEKAELEQKINNNLEKLNVKEFFSTFFEMFKKVFTSLFGVNLLNETIKNSSKNPQDNINDKKIQIEKDEKINEDKNNPSLESFGQYSVFSNKELNIEIYKGEIRQFSINSKTYELKNIEALEDTKESNIKIEDEDGKYFLYIGDNKKVSLDEFSSFVSKNPYDDSYTLLKDVGLGVDLVLEKEKVKYQEPRLTDTGENTSDKFGKIFYAEMSENGNPIISYKGVEYEITGDGIKNFPKELSGSLIIANGEAFMATESGWGRKVEFKKLIEGLKREIIRNPLINEIEKGGLLGYISSNKNKNFESLKGTNDFKFSSNIKNILRYFRQIIQGKKDAIKNFKRDAIKIGLEKTKELYSDSNEIIKNKDKIIQTIIDLIKSKQY